jgi:hypothetical protein
VAVTEIGLVNPAARLVCTPSPIASDRERWLPVHPGRPEPGRSPGPRRSDLSPSSVPVPLQPPTATRSQPHNWPESPAGTGRRFKPVRRRGGWASARSGGRAVAPG